MVVVVGLVVVVVVADVVPDADAFDVDALEAAEELVDVAGTVVVPVLELELELELELAAAFTPGCSCATSIPISAVAPAATTTMVRVNRRRRTCALARDAREFSGSFMSGPHGFSSARVHLKIPTSR